MLALKNIFIVLIFTLFPFLADADPVPELH